MVHNGIEYGLMQAYAEGLALLRAKKDLNLDVAAIAESWRHGTVIRSWLLDLTAEFLAEDADLRAIAPRVADSGEGRWTAIEAVELGVPTPVMTLALMERFASQDGATMPIASCASATGLRRHAHQVIRPSQPAPCGSRSAITSVPRRSTRLAGIAAVPRRVLSRGLVRASDSHIRWRARQRGSVSVMRRVPSCSPDIATSRSRAPVAGHSDAVAIAPRLSCTTSGAAVFRRTLEDLAAAGCRGEIRRADRHVEQVIAAAGPRARAGLER
jgi:hypothetical protein